MWSPSEVCEQLKDSNLRCVGSIPPVVTTEPTNQRTASSILRLDSSECHRQVDEIQTDADNKTAMNIIADFTIDVVSPSELLTGAEVVLDSSPDKTSQKCPPILALEAIEKDLTPKKKASYNLKKRKRLSGGKRSRLCNMALLKATG